LGGAAKISPCGGMPSDQKTAVICIYTDDYFNHDDVMRVRMALRTLGFKVETTPLHISLNVSLIFVPGICAIVETEL
jgi:hypothetical protein